MTDVQGDLLHFMMPNIVQPITRQGWQEKVPNPSVDEALSDMGPFQVLYPVSRYADPRQLAQIKTVVEANGHKFIEIGLRMQDLDNVAEVEYLLRL